MPQTNKEIADSIRALAKARGVTVKETLEACRINRNFIYDLEHGNSSPSVDKIARIAEYFGVSTAKLLGGAEGEVKALLALYEQLSPSAKEELRAYMQKLLEQ
ncbi:MAG: helix-turn-helix transcriptional regulator [Clostridia bacterium]|nr:helix-turn-helix transcriptional regulator [Clostridia bacterium]